MLLSVYDSLTELKQANKAIQESGLEISAQRDDLEKQRNQILTQTNQITDSILYAKRIQTAMMAAQDEFDYPKYNSSMEFISNNPRWW